MTLEQNRSALQDISRSPYTMRASSESNLVIPESFLTPSPEEQIIRQRGRKLLLDASMLEYTPRTPPKDVQCCSRKRLLASPSDGVCHSDKKYPQNGTSAPSLKMELCAYTPHQLADVIEKLVTAHPHLETELRSSLPSPDLAPLEERLLTLRRDIYKALPSPRCGGHTRDASSYRHVKIHVEAFKRSCVEQGRLLLTSRCWLGLFKYSCTASRLAANLPVWEATAHNRPRQHCLRLLAAQCRLSLKRGHFQSDQLHTLQARLKAAIVYNPELKSSLEEVFKQLNSHGKV